MEIQCLTGNDHGNVMSDQERTMEMQCLTGNDHGNAMSDQ